MRQRICNRSRNRSDEFGKSEHVLSLVRWRRRGEAKSHQYKFRSLQIHYDYTKEEGAYSCCNIYKNKS